MKVIGYGLYTLRSHFLIYDRIQNEYFLTVLELAPQLGSFYPLDDKLRARLDNIFVDPLLYGLALDYICN